MKSFTKKSFLQKIIITIVIAILFSNFIMPTYSHANVFSDIGGVIFDAITDFVVILEDGIETLLQYFMLGDNQNDGKLRDVDITVKSTEAEEYDLTTSGTADFSLKSDEIDLGWGSDEEVYRVPNIKYTPEEIFIGHTPFLQVNFISPQKAYDSNGNEVDGIAQTLQKTIAEWYVALRNLAIVGLLSVLVYVGIRIILSSTAPEKAKYKQLFTDWLIAMCLLFFLHYIMSFTLTLTEAITQSLAGNKEEGSVIVEVEGDGQYKTNVMGAARFLAQSDNNIERISYIIIYGFLIGYTILFTFVYLKRTMMMAFLTVIAPLVALTYPIDKMNDGQAQAFNKWLMEFVFNALLQPFHLIIYYVFVMSAMDLATNPIYVIAVLLFILSAEKILRTFFGFNKASSGTVGALTGFTMGSLANKFLGGKGGKGSGKSGGSNSSENEKPPRFEKKHDTDEIEDPEDTDKFKSKNEDDSSNKEDDEKKDSIVDRAADALSEDSNDDENAEESANVNNDINNEVNVQPQNPEQANEQNKNNQDKNEKEKSKSSPYHGKEDQEHMLKGLKNLKRAHKGAGKKAIKGVAKFGTKAAFTIAGTTTGAILGVGAGKGLAGIGAGAFAGYHLGQKLGNTAIGLPGNVIGAGRTIANVARTEIDTFNGNNNMQDKASRREWKKDENNLKYIRDQLTAQNGGAIPSEREVRDKMNSFDPYLEEGLTDIKDMLKAQKAEQYIQGSDIKKAHQAAVIAAIGKERGITPDVLNDQKKAMQSHQNLKQEFINKGHSEAVAEKQANYTMNILKIQNGVANSIQNPALAKQTSGSQSNGQSQPRQLGGGNNQQNIRTKGKSTKSRKSKK